MTKKREEYRVDKLNKRLAETSKHDEFGLESLVTQKMIEYGLTYRETAALLSDETISYSKQYIDKITAGNVGIACKQVKKREILRDRISSAFNVSKDYIFYKTKEIPDDIFKNKLSEDQFHRCMTKFRLQMRMELK